MDRPIGVFDSGLGGISTLKELTKYMPHENFIYFGDSEFAPYGTKTKEEIIERCKYICELFIKKNVKAIVIACNTATSAAAPTLRDLYKNIPILGLEPALKAAADYKDNSTIAVMATPLTLKESKFNRLMESYISTNNIIKIPCPELVTIVEQNRINDETLVLEQLKKYYSNLNIESIDSVVLGCTHFIFYKKYLQKILADHTKIFDGNIGVTIHLYNTLEKANLLNPSTHKGEISIHNSSCNLALLELSYKLLNI